jgi:hypothetical protein
MFSLEVYMKRTISLSLLLLIVGNGLTVSKTHANFKDAQVMVGVMCFVFGGSSLIKASYNIIDLYNKTQHLSTLKNTLPTRLVANPDSDNHARIFLAENDIKKTKKTFVQEAAIAIPLAALGFYLLKKG